MDIHKHPIHTTISTEALSILERYEKEMGAKNTVLERALIGMDKLRLRGGFDAGNFNRIVKRIPVGIPGVDALIEGGIPEGFVVLASGLPGSGKTTFCLQFLVEGLKNNERCIYFSFEEQREHLVKQAYISGVDVCGYIEKGYLEIFGFTMLSGEEIVEILHLFKPKRIVLDSLNTFFDPREFRKTSEWRSVLKEIKTKKITCIAITEKKHGMESKEFDDFDFMSDGIIFFDKTHKDTYSSYCLQIQKMRLTKINETPHHFKFSERGLELIGKPFSIVKK